MTLGGNVRESLAWYGDPGLATAIAWHLAGMWLLGASFLTCVLWGVFSGHFWRDFMAVGPFPFFGISSRPHGFSLPIRAGSTTWCRRDFAGA